jgi:hypothetical protein
MKKKYSNSLDNIMTKDKGGGNYINIIDKEYIMAMFNPERTKKKGKFRIFK